MFFTPKLIGFTFRRRLRPVLLATGLSRPQQLTFNRVAAMMRAQVVNTISPDVTHVITGATVEVSSDVSALSKKSFKRNSSNSAKTENKHPKEASCPRTLKFLNAVLQVGCTFRIIRKSAPFLSTELMLFAIRVRPNEAYG